MGSTLIGADLMTSPCLDAHNGGSGQAYLSRSTRPHPYSLYVRGSVAVWHRDVEGREGSRQGTRTQTDPIVYY